MSEEKSLDDMTLEELKQLVPAKELAEAEQLALEKWLNAPLSDNDVFINFCNNRNICRALVHILLKNFGVKIDKPNITYEKSANINFDSKDVKFDMYIEDDYVIIDMEMQVVIKLMNPKRLRTYQAVIDIEQIKKSGKYESLKDTYIVVICLDDPFGHNVPAYRIKKSPEPFDLDEFDVGEFDVLDYIDKDFNNSIFKNLEEFDPKDLENYFKKMNRKHKKVKCTEYVDDANIIFFNASLFYKVKNKELRTFLAFIVGFHFKDCEFYHIIKERFDITKINKKAKLSFMTSYYRELDREFLMKEKLTKKLTKTITEEIVLNMIDLEQDDETISILTKMPVEEVARVRKENS